MKKKVFGFCSLECTQCPAYIAMQTNDDALREKTAQEWSEKYGHPFSQEQINCSGCKEQKKVQCGYCKICPIRACATKKKNDGCYACEDLESCAILLGMERETLAPFRQMSLERKNK